MTTAFPQKAVTVITAKRPAKVGKNYRSENGQLVKQAVADVWEGIARTVHVPNAAAMVELLKKTTDSENMVICNGIFRGAGDKAFTILTEKRFREVVERGDANYGDVLKAGELYLPKTGPYAGKLVGARKKELQMPSAWVLLDADEPKGFPEAWRGLSFQDRLELLEPYAPGLSTAERVELRGSSARVVKGDGKLGAASHGWVCCDNPEDMARAAVALQIHATAGGTYFDSPRHSRVTGEVIGAMARTSIDLAPWHRGRLNFDTLPTLDATAAAEGYWLADAGIEVVNPGGGLFSPSVVAPVTKAATQVYREKTGHTIHVSRGGAGVMQINQGQLTLATQVEVRGEVKTLGAWADHMAENEIRKLRCEAPFRASESEAAFIGWGHDGPFIYDIGVATKYVLAPEAVDDFCDFDVADVNAELELGEDFAELKNTSDPEGDMGEGYETLKISIDAELGSDECTAAPAGHDMQEPSEAEKQGSAADTAAGDDDGKASSNIDDVGACDDEFNPDDPLTLGDVKAADISISEGVRIVDTYRDQQLKKLNFQIGYAIVEGKGVIVRIGRNGIGELGPQFIAIDAERNRLANRVVPFVEVRNRELMLVWKKIFSVWLEWKDRRTYDGVVFDPKREVVAKKRLPPASRDGMKALNLFVGTAWAPLAGDSQPILDHIRDVLCGGQEEAYEYCLSWMARMVQEPELPAETVLVFRSGQGVGKNTITNIFRRYFGAHGLEITNDRELTGFNDHLATSIFVSLNEACWGGNRQSEGTLKSLITEREITVERKYVPRFKIRNCTHLIVSSNSDWAIPVGHDDRRFVVFNPSNHRVGDTPYFEALNDHKGLVWGDGAKGARAFIQLLLDRDISRFKPRKLPTVVGTIKLEQKIQSANTVAKWIMGVLREGGLHVAEEVDGGAGTTRVWLELSAQPITTDALYREYRAYTGGERPEVMEMFAKKLREILGDTIDATRPSSNYRPTPRAHFAAASRGRPPCYRFKALAEARAAFADYIHEDIQW